MEELCALSDAIQDMEDVEIRLAPDETAYIINLTGSEAEKVLDAAVRDGRVPTLFLHSCCAPCSSYVLSYLASYFRITLYYYNPNISPKEEYQKRVQEQMRLIRELPVRYPICFEEGVYDSERFFEMAKGMEDIPEGGERCFRCYELRQREAAIAAAQGGYDYFCLLYTSDAADE